MSAARHGSAAKRQLDLSNGVNVPRVSFMGALLELTRHRGRGRAGDSGWPGGHHICPECLLVMNLVTLMQLSTPRDTLVRIRNGGQFVS